MPMDLRTDGFDSKEDSRRKTTTTTLVFGLVFNKVLDEFILSRASSVPATLSEIPHGEQAHYCVLIAEHWGAFDSFMSPSAPRKQNAIQME